MKSVVNNGLGDSTDSRLSLEGHMAKVTVLCSRCGKPVQYCAYHKICPDNPEDESFGFSLNRWGEEMMRFLRFWGLLK
jgi:hypothetical protein